MFVHVLFQCWRLGPVYFSQCLCTSCFSAVDWDLFILVSVCTCCFSAVDWDLFILVSVCARVVSVLETGTCLF